nr:hypothetical protein [uncultured Albidiferax sp.]
MVHSPTIKEQHSASNGALCIVVLATIFNSLLAFINGNITYLNESHVAISEAIILSFTCYYIWTRYKSLKQHWLSLSFIYAILLIFLWVSLFYQSIYIKSVRDMMLISIFIILGGLAEEKGLIKMMRLLTAALFFFMIMEGWFTDLYVFIFKPAAYYASTRGVQELSTDSSGLFRNSLGFTGRFSFGIFETHRLSSLFLEQVSLANFSMVLGIFTIALWDRINKNDRIFFITAILFILFTNNTRTGSIFNLFLFIGYFLFPKLPRFTPILYTPALILFSFIFFYDPHFHEATLSDDMKGRIGLTLYKFSHMDISSFFVGNVSQMPHVQDSGYLYLIYSQTGLGFILYLIYTSIIVPDIDASTKRFAHGLSLFIALNLLIGAGIFTIKIAAPLWFIAGYMAKQASQKPKKGLLNAQIGKRTVGA